MSPMLLGDVLEENPWLPRVLRRQWHRGFRWGSFVGAVLAFSFDRWLA